MGKRQKGVTLARIVDAALTHFADAGPGASLSAVAAALDIRTPTLLQHVKSKRHLVVMVRKRVRGELTALIADAHVDGPAELVALYHRVLAFFIEDPRRPRFLLRDMMETARPYDAVLKRFVELTCAGVGGPESVGRHVAITALGVLLSTAVLPAAESHCGTLRAQLRTLVVDD